MLIIRVSIQINLDVIFLVSEVIDSLVGDVIVVQIDNSILCLVEIMAMGSIFDAVSRTWGEIVMLAHLSEGLVAPCLHCSVGATSIIIACIHHVLSSHI